MDSDEAKLIDGADWAEHEDCLIGNEAGLRNLKQACEIALEEGEYFGDNLGGYVGVKKLSTDWFEASADPKHSIVSNCILGLAVCVALLLMLSGGYSIFVWIF